MAGIVERLVDAFNEIGAEGGCDCEDCRLDVAYGLMTATETRGCDRHPVYGLKILRRDSE